LFPNAKVRKRGTFSEVLGVSSSAELDSGRCPKNPPTFEKVGSKLYTCYSSFLLQHFDQIGDALLEFYTVPVLFVAHGCLDTVAGVISSDPHGFPQFLAQHQ